MGRLWFGVEELILALRSPGDRPGHGHSEIERELSRAEAEYVILALTLPIDQAGFPTNRAAR